MRHLTLLAGLAVLLAACDGPTRPTSRVPTQFFTLSGTVTAQGQPLAGARVQVVEGAATTETSAITDSEGRYEISGLRGSVDLQAWKPGYYPAWLCCPNGFDSLGSNLRLDPGQRLAVGDTVHVGTEAGGSSRECEVQISLVPPPPCLIFALTPTAPGVLEIELTWEDAVDLALSLFTINGETAAPSGPRGRRVVRPSVTAGETYEVRVLGVSTPFNLTVK